jgi:hypothetical protein
MDAKVTGPDAIQLQLNDKERNHIAGSIITTGFMRELLDAAGLQMGTITPDGTDILDAVTQEDGSLALDRSQAAAIRDSLHLAAAAHHLLGNMLDPHMRSVQNDKANVYLGLASDFKPVLGEQ